MRQSPVPEAQCPASMAKSLRLAPKCSVSVAQLHGLDDQQGDRDEQVAT
jgi:hypothetical protein